MNYNIHEYGFLRVAAASPEHKVADVEFNTEKIISIIDTALKNKCNIILFPELCITGYTCADLFYQQVLLSKVKVAIDKIAAYTASTSATVIVGAPIACDGKLYNCAVFISSGEIKGIVPKTFLCNTNEYYEERWFSSEYDRYSNAIDWDGKEIPFGADLLFQYSGIPNCILGVEICEDLWSVIPPSSEMALVGATVILNLSASDEVLSKNQYRKNLIKSHSASSLCCYAYSSCGPGESSTDVVFPGLCILAENGIVLSESDRFSFESQIIYTDFDIDKIINERFKNNSFANSILNKNYRRINFSIPEIHNSLQRHVSQTPFVPMENKDRNEVCKEIFSIQTSGLAKRVKHLGDCPVVVGISGGLDSTLALLVAIKTFEKLGLSLNGIHAVSMPGFGSTGRTQTNAKELANLLEVSFKNVSIKESVKKHFSDIGHNPDIHDIVYENSQARERTQILMDIANQVKGIVVGTGDLSELALGWSTYSGDHISMYGVNSGVPKTLVKYIIEWCADEGFSGKLTKILKDICNTPISPELLPPDNKDEILQKTEDTIGPFLLHDFYLYYAIRFSFSPKKIVLLAEKAFAGKFNKQEIIKYLKIFYERFFANQFKRSCLPDGIKVGTLALSPRGDWRMPSDASTALWLKELNELRM
jgi:NAD+ synthase (glutamine-hydrolysing)